MSHRRPPLAQSVQLFLRAWARTPLKVGSVVPSSRYLSRAMAAQVDLTRPGLIVELGAGTGVVTHALLERGIAPDRLLVVERDPRLHRMLTEHFPTLTILEEDATRLCEVLKNRGVTQVCAVVSSLPLLSMPAAIQQAIVEQIFTALGGQGPLIQFTYGPRSSVTQEQQAHFHVRARRAAWVPLNLPPATVWVYQ